MGSQTSDVKRYQPDMTIHNIEPAKVQSKSVWLLSARFQLY